MTLSTVARSLQPPGITPENEVIVQLSEEDYTKSWAAGAMRLLANLHKNDAPSYRHGANQPEHIAQPLAVMGEVAVARHLGLGWDWNKAVWDASDHHANRNKADVGANIEVRRVRNLRQKPSLRSRQCGRNLAVFFVYPMPPEYLQVKILGWVPQDEVWGDCIPAIYNGEPSRESRQVPHELFRPCTCITGGKHQSSSQDVNWTPPPAVLGALIGDILDGTKQKEDE